MKLWWKTSLALSLGLLVSGTDAAEKAWRPNTPPPTSPSAAVGVTLDRPMVPGQPVPSETTTTGNGVIRPAAFVPQRTAVIRAQGPDGDIIAVSPTSAGTQNRMHSWRRAEEANPPRKIPIAEGVIRTSGPQILPQPSPIISTPVPGTPTTIVPVPAVAASQGDPCISAYVVDTSPSWIPKWGFEGWGCNACDDCSSCYPGNRFYMSGEFLLWWTKGSPLPPLVTTGSIANGGNAGALGNPDTRVLFGDDDVADQLRTGARFMMGYWFDDCRRWGIDGGFFFLNKQHDNFNDSSNGDRVITRPAMFINPTRAVEIVSTPGVGNNPPPTAGTINVNHESSFWGGEFNFRRNLWCNCDSFIDVIAGYRYLRLDESLSITETPVVLADSINANGVVVIPAGTLFVVNDQFKTNNQFHGGQLGLVGETRRGAWSLGWSAKVGLGNTRQTVDILGSTAITVPVNNVGIQPGTFNFTGGALALPSNMGRYSRDVFTVVPEIGLNVGYQLTDNLRLFAGYNFLYWSRVVRPGEQIDLVVNQEQLAPPIAVPGNPPRPALLFRQSDFWAQGINLGLEFRW